MIVVAYEHRRNLEGAEEGKCPPPHIFVPKNALFLATELKRSK
jgi:hypothetical protein